MSANNRRQEANSAILLAQLSLSLLTDFYLSSSSSGSKLRARLSSQLGLKLEPRLSLRRLIRAAALARGRILVAGQFVGSLLMGAPICRRQFGWLRSPAPPKGF